MTHQGILERIFSLGSVGLSTAGQSDFEILLPEFGERYRTIGYLCECDRHATSLLGTEIRHILRLFVLLPGRI